ncbi:MAG: PadR family transcriptional regulator [Acidobacteria bacterium]|nr:PadR family transcriptional regulator [Acidobacteriota bacterium]
MGKQEAISGEFLPGTLALLILKALERGPLHGYGIAKRVKESSGEVLAVEEGSLYPALNRLLVGGFVQAEWGISDNNRRARFYELTREGRKRLEAESREFERLVGAIQMVLRTA